MFIIYGAYGYTGKLIVEEAKKKGLEPILSGRSEEKLKPLAEKHQLKYQVAEVDNLSPLDEYAKEAKFILNCAGPFSRTAKKVIEYCIEKGFHYLDITGEIEVFELAAHYGKKAEAAGVMLMPGTGFDVVPSDCLAAYLKSKMPDAQSLLLAFKSLGGGLSHGTATTMVENINAGGAIREKGKIKKVRSAYKTKMIDYGKGEKLSVTIPWGDVSTAYYSTGIPNIMVYTAVPPSQARMMKMVNYIGWFLGIPAVNNFMKKKIKKGGPGEETRKKSASLLYGEVTNEKGEKAAARIKCKDGYTLTALSSIIISQKILDGNFKKGFATPSLAYGMDLILETEGAERTEMV